MIFPRVLFIQGVLLVLVLLVLVVFVLLLLMVVGCVCARI